MVDVALPTQLQQWTIEKPIVRSERSDSSLTTPELTDEVTSCLRIVPPTRSESNGLDASTLEFPDHYDSSEEELSPMEPDYDDDVLSLHDGSDDASIFNATPLNQAGEKEQSKLDNHAVVVSYVSVGKPKMIEVSTITTQRERPFRSSSVGNALQSTERPVLRPSRLSVSSTPGDSTVKTYQTGPRRPSTAKATHSAKPQDSRTSLSSSQDSIRSSSSTPPCKAPGLSLSINTRRPQTSRGSTFPVANPFHQPASKPNNSFRSSLMALSPRTTSSNFPPLTPVTPQTPSFLESDPYATNHSAPKHRRLRSISRTLSLAKIAVLPSSSRKSSTASIPSEISAQSIYSPKASIQVNGLPSPTTPRTPMSAFPQSTTNLLESPKIPQARRFSQHERAMPMHMQPLSSQCAEPRRSGMDVRERPRMVARGAAEREPVADLKSFLDEMDVSNSGLRTNCGSDKRRTVRKRKSLLGLYPS